jgi:hypothetical protein|tara:strand:- start:623 stop:853 length:231 start_codon:yes stop_codon:yes gene_type:complete
MNQSILNISAFIALVSTTIVSADTLYVGVNEKYKSIDEVQHVVEDGDTVEIVPGVYRDCAVFEANNITVRPKGWPK